jgi:ABC-type antimicrobial peptide transport system permease subunit
MALIIRQGMIPVVLGLLVGLACAMSLSRVIGSQLYGVMPNDPIVILAVASTLAVLSMCACWIPARRVTQIDPVVALRFE